MRNKDYSDIIDLPHHVSKNRMPMSLYNRAAQFAPFAALRGYEEAIAETARQTDQKVSLSDNQVDDIDFKMQILEKNLEKHYEVTIQYFQKDKRKEGGTYITMTGIIKKFDYYHQTIILMNGKMIHFDDIVALSSPLFSKMDME